MRDSGTRSLAAGRACQCSAITACNGSSRPRSTNPTASAASSTSRRSKQRPARSRARQREYIGHRGNPRSRRPARAGCSTRAPNGRSRPRLGASFLPSPDDFFGGLHVQNVAVAKGIQRRFAQNSSPNAMTCDVCDRCFDDRTIAADMLDRHTHIYEGGAVQADQSLAVRVPAALRYQLLHHTGP
jgi:hypothetical protein